MPVRAAGDGPAAGEGVEVAWVWPDSPAAGAGVAAGDRIVSIKDADSAAQAVNSAALLAGAIAACPALAQVDPATGVDFVTISAIGNDYGYEQVFARQVRALGRAGDCLIAISTSGNSPNMLTALQDAAELGVTRIGLLGRDGGKMLPLCDLAIVVPSNDTARIQESHIFLAHTLCADIEIELGLVP